MQYREKSFLIKIKQNKKFTARISSILKLRVEKCCSLFYCVTESRYCKLEGENRFKWRKKELVRRGRGVIHCSSKITH